MAASTACSEASVMTEVSSDALLATDALAKRFGGVTASDNISLNIAKGELHAIIGPNGAGKTTLIGQLAGEITPDGGRIIFDGSDITALPVHRRSQIGLARSFQITSLFSDFSVLDNVALAVQAHAGHSFRFWRDARSESALRQPAREILDRLGLGARADVPVARLSHGERRQLEIAMALVTRPRLLLLDEPMAGMGPDESARLVETLRQLKGSLTILLIEHDMDAVFALADRISVLVYGRIIASGDGAAIKADPAVRQAYLGEHEAVGQGQGTAQETAQETAQGATRV
jgi:branched-chain amino acid transport system ATP-binding protein